MAQKANPETPVETKVTVEKFAEAINQRKVKHIRFAWQTEIELAELNAAIDGYLNDDYEIKYVTQFKLEENPGQPFKHYMLYVLVK